MADVEAIGRLISLGLRSGIPMSEIHRQLRGISSDRVIGLGPEQGDERAGRHRHRHREVDAGESTRGAAGAPLTRRRPGSLSPRTVAVQPPSPSAGQALAELESPRREQSFVGACPDCGSQLEFAEGCMKCHVCGYSECG